MAQPTRKLPDLLERIAAAINREFGSAGRTIIARFVPREEWDKLAGENPAALEKFEGAETLHVAAGEYELYVDPMPMDAEEEGLDA